jgi:rRNA maturation protein Nop10
LKKLLEFGYEKGKNLILDCPEKGELTVAPVPAPF